jgi:hypothetical protein
MNQLKRITGSGFTLLTILWTAILGVATLFGAIGCDNGTKQCDCPNKIHGNSSCNCGDVDCICEQREYSLDYNVKVINETGGKLRAGLITDIETAMDDITASIMASISTRNAKIIITNDDDDDFTYDTITIGSRYLVDYASIKFNLEYMFGEMEKILSMNRHNSSTYLVNGKDMNASAGWVAYQRGFSRMAQQWVKNSRVYGA